MSYGLISPMSNINHLGAFFGPCDGKRLDNLAKNQYMTPKTCISKGGNCCATDPNRDFCNENIKRFII